MVPTVLLTGKSEEVFGIKENVFKLVYELYSCYVTLSTKLVP